MKLIHCHSKIKNFSQPPPPSLFGILNFWLVTITWAEKSRIFSSNFNFIKCFAKYHQLYQIIAKSQQKIIVTVFGPKPWIQIAWTQKYLEFHDNNVKSSNILLIKTFRFGPYLIFDLSKHWNVDYQYWYAQYILE